jgi:hypothetical protein
MTLHRRGLSNKEIVDVIEIKQKYGVKLASSVISECTRGIYSPYNGRYVLPIELLRAFRSVNEMSSCCNLPRPWASTNVRLNDEAHRRVNW